LFLFAANTGIFDVTASFSEITYTQGVYHQHTLKTMEDVTAIASYGLFNFSASPMTCARFFAARPPVP
jgi:hypothetical protein